MDAEAFIHAIDVIRQRCESPEEVAAAVKTSIEKDDSPEGIGGPITGEKFQLKTYTPRGEE